MKQTVVVITYHGMESYKVVAVIDYPSKEWHSRQFDKEIEQKIDEAIRADVAEWDYQDFEELTFRKTTIGGYNGVFMWPTFDGQEDETPFQVEIKEVL